jgi:membrane protein DedA with SNARE-associated domain
MTFYFERLVDFVGAHPQLSFLAVFLLALSEAVPVVGTVVPGSTLILAISALATAAGITPWGLLVAAVAGAIAGDGFSFWLGHRYHRQILRGWPLNRFPRLIGRSAQLIRKYGVASVFLARFTAVVRAFVPLLAGIGRMSSRHFYVANVSSALVWAPLHIFPGVLVGLAIAFGGAHAPELSLAAIGVLILAWIAWSMIKRKTASIMKRAGNEDAPGSGTRESAPRPIAHETAPDVARPTSPRGSASGSPTQRAKSCGTHSDSARLLFSPQNPSGDQR